MGFGYGRNVARFGCNRGSIVLRLKGGCAEIEGPLRWVWGAADLRGIWGIEKCRGIGYNMCHCSVTFCCGLFYFNFAEEVPRFDGL